MAGDPDGVTRFYQIGAQASANQGVRGLCFEVPDHLRAIAAHGKETQSNMRISPGYLQDLTLKLFEYAEIVLGIRMVSERCNRSYDPGEESGDSVHLPLFSRRAYSPCVPGGSEAM